MKEEAFLFGNLGSLVGIVTDPTEGAGAENAPAVILLNSGLVHRVGPNRLYVKMARDLASAGFSVLRFDLSGIGDSNVRSDNLPFQEGAVKDTQEAMNFMASVRGIDRFILMGICSGAAVSYFASHADSRVVGAILVNGRDYLHNGSHELGLYLRRRTLSRHYRRIARSSLFSGKKWLRALTGRLDYRKVVRMIRGVRKKHSAPEKHWSSEVEVAAANLHRLIQGGTRLLVIHSGADEGLDYLHVILGDKVPQWSQSGDLRLEIIEDANHTFTDLWSQEHLAQLVRTWLQSMRCDKQMVPKS